MRNDITREKRQQQFKKQGIRVRVLASILHSKKKYMKQLLFILAMILSLGLVFTACADNASNAKTEQLAQDETYTCTMHNEVMGEHPGVCPKCEMKLIKQKMTAEQQRMKTEGTYVKPKG